MVTFFANGLHWGDEVAIFQVRSRLHHPGGHGDFVPRRRGVDVGGDRVWIWAAARPRTGPSLFKSEPHGG